MNDAAPNFTPLAKSFEPASIEARWTAMWEERGYYRAGLDASKPAFSMQLPPPNVTGLLHMGHGFNHTIMDALTRYHRMAGFNTLWLPGTDHAGIATQIVVERQLEANGVDRRTMGREAFIKQVWDWKEYSGGTILNQMRRLGDSVDWSRTYFTMDERLSKVVTETFVQLYEQGLIYRGKRLVNWDPKLQTDPAGDDAGRRRGRCASGGRALHAPRGPAAGAAADGPHDPGHRRRVRRSRVRHRLREDHTRA